MASLRGSARAGLTHPGPKTQRARSYTHYQDLKEKNDVLPAPTPSLFRHDTNGWIWGESELNSFWSLIPLSPSIPRTETKDTRSPPLSDYDGWTRSNSDRVIPIMHSSADKICFIRTVYCYHKYLSWLYGGFPYISMALCARQCSEPPNIDCCCSS